MTESTLLQHQYDVTVIGGGIHGAGVAQAAAAAGYKVLLLEKNDWAAGTSCKSSKLIHGGLRYLQSGQFSLVRESIREREILLKIAPELVRRNKFYIPVYDNSHYKNWQLRIGLSLYALFGFNRKACRFSVLKPEQGRQLSKLKTHGLQKVFCYPDAQTDDRLLTRAVIDSAQGLGAKTLAPATLRSAKYVGGGYTLSFQYQNQQHDTLSRIVINAGGPWANHVNQLVTPVPPTAKIDLVQGTHLILAGQLSDACFYLEAPQDQRAIFVMPWYGNTLLGTTEILFEGNPDDVEPLDSEKEYLMAVIRHYFPDFETSVIDAFAGLRVLPKESNASAFHRSRETQLICDQQKSPQWITIYGGKLTGYRATAEKVVKLIRTTVGKRKAIASTRSLPLKLNLQVNGSRPKARPDAPVMPDANEQNAD